MLVVVVAIVVVVAAELLVEVFGAAVEVVWMGMLASVAAELLSPAPNVKREPAEGKINRC